MSDSFAALFGERRGRGPGATADAVAHAERVAERWTALGIAPHVGRALCRIFAGETLATGKAGDTSATGRAKSNLARSKLLAVLAFVVTGDGSDDAPNAESFGLDYHEVVELRARIQGMHGPGISAIAEMINDQNQEGKNA